MAINFRGYVFQDDGDPVSGATVALLETGTTTQEASTTTNSDGLWSFSESDQDRYDVKISSGTSVRYMRWDDQISLKEIDVRNNTGNTTPAVTFTNLTNNASNQVAVFSGANTTRADGDEIYLSFKLADADGNIDEFARITAEAVDVTSGQEDGQLRFGVAKTDGTMTDVFTINSTTGGETSMTLDVSGDLVLDADGGDIFFKDGGTTFGSATNSSGNLILKSGTTTAATFSGANVTLAGTVGSGAITSTGIVTGTGFTAGNAVLAEAELELLDGLTAGTAIASKVVTTDANIDTSGQRNLTITGELDAATLDLSGAADIAGDLVLSGGADGALQFTNAGENSIKIPDNQASALIIEQANNAYITFVTTDSSEAITVAKATTFSAGIANSGTIAAGTWNGTAIATAYIADDAITSAKIADDAIVTAAIADDAITSALIADDAIVTAAIADDAITSALIADDAVVTAAIADDAITSALIADDAVTGATINNDIISAQSEIASGLATADELLYSDGGTVKRVGLDTLTTYLAGVNAGTVTSTGLSDSSGVISLDIQNMTASSTIADADLIVIDDGAGGALRKMTRANFIESAALDAINIDGGAIDGTVIGANSAAAGTFAAVVGTTGTFSGVLDITDATDSSDASGDTGALRTEGGASIAKKLYVGTDLDVDGTAEVDAFTIGGTKVPQAVGTRYIQVIVADSGTALVAAPGTGKAYVHIPADLDGMNLVEVHAEVNTAPAGETGGTCIIIQIHNETHSADMLTAGSERELTIDASHTGSDQAGTAAVIVATEDDVQENDLLRIDVDQVGSSTAGSGLIVTMGFRIP